MNELKLSPEMIYSRSDATFIGHWFPFGIVLISVITLIVYASVAMEAAGEARAHPSPYPKITHTYARLGPTSFAVAKSLVGPILLAAGAVMVALGVFLTYPSRESLNRESFIVMMGGIDLDLKSSQEFQALQGDIAAGRVRIDGGRLIRQELTEGGIRTP